MDLATLLPAGTVRVVADVSSKKRLMTAIAEAAAGGLGLAPNDIARALLEREALGPTGFGKGVALPHARLPGIERVTGLFLKLDHPMNFDAADRQPVDLVFAFFAPEAAGSEHLKALALVSRTMRDGFLCEKLRANSDPATLRSLLLEARAMQAA